ncbi:MAG: Manganese catalase [uncultured Rubrobacteraceae bacterium]|uniref:Manganese catalase n=1 Tax=uncultured Rubrobacteraceae bacterium TaxID=349277 RepID=A0A6J4QDA5_9ACTN|nr:MAG: Manganese catalase [uncultured Rubrobacteraceae bacterium]
MQELLGGKFGEMSTLMNYTYQSFNMRGKSKVRPYYDLVANIAAEEMGHIELVANTINLLLDQTEASRDGITPPLNFSGMTGNPNHFLNFGLGAMDDANGKAWTGDNIFNSGNLKMDLLHNFFLESGARMGKIRVYEATQNPVACEMIGYLIVRDGVHQEAYAKALSDLSGVDVTKLLPVPEIYSNNYPAARKYMDKGFHRILYRFSPDDYKEISQIWNGLSAIDGSEREVQDGPPEGGEVPDLNPAPPLFAPGVDPEDIAEIVKRLG